MTLEGRSCSNPAPNLSFGAKSALPVTSHLPRAVPEFSPRSHPFPRCPMRICNLSIAPDQRRQGHCLQTILLSQFIASNHDRIVHVFFFHPGLHRLPSVGVRRHANDHQPLVLVLLRKLVEPGNFDLAAFAPCRSKIHQNHFPFRADSFTSFPCASCNWKSGATCRSLSGFSLV
jgi:hypothetical protein